MGTEKEKVELEQAMTTTEVIGYLNDLAKSLESGQLIVRQGTRAVCLEPPAMLEMAIKAKRKKDRAKFALELSWKQAKSIVQEPSLKISPLAPPADKD